MDTFKRGYMDPHKHRKRLKCTDINFNVENEDGK